MGTLPPDVLAALERALKAAGWRTQCRDILGAILPVLAEREAALERRLRAEFADGEELVELALEAEASASSRLAEAVASEGRLRAGLEESKLTAHADLARARESAKDDCELCRELALHLARCHATLTAPPSRALTELLELRAACIWLLGALADPMRWQELVNAQGKASAAIAATDWLAGPEGG